MSGTSRTMRGAASAASRIAVRRLALPTLVLPALVLSGCTATAAASAPSSTPHPSYAIAVPGPNVRTPPVVAPGGYELVAAGDPVRFLTTSTDAFVTASGPDVDVPVPAPGQPQVATRAHGVLTVTVAVRHGALRVVPSAFLGLDERAKRIVLHADRGVQTATPGHPVTLHLSTTFATGHTTLTWQPTGSPLVTWDCTIEID